MTLFSFHCWFFSKPKTLICRLLKLLEPWLYPKQTTHSAVLVARRNFPSPLLTQKLQPYGNFTRKGPLYQFIICFGNEFIHAFGKSTAVWVCAYIRKPSTVSIFSFSNFLLSKREWMREWALHTWMASLFIIFIRCCYQTRTRDLDFSHERGSF